MQTHAESRGGLKILVVEDEALIAEEIQERLTHLGYQVLDIADTAQSAIERAEQLRPDLVLMDIQLKGERDGIEAADQIYRRLNIPVVHLTAHSDRATLQRAWRTAPFGYVIKPFQERDLQIAIEMAIPRFQLEQGLKESDLTYATILTGIADGVVAVDAESRVRYLNPVAEDLTGWKLADAQGVAIEQVFQMIEESTRERIGNPVLRTLAERVAFKFKDHTMLLDRQGRTIPIEHSVAPIIGTDGKITGAVVTFRDITERFENRKRLQHQLERLAALHAIDMCIVYNRDLPLTLGLILDQTRMILGVDAVAILLLNRESGSFEYAVRRGFPKGYEQLLYAGTWEDPVEVAAREGRIFTLADMGEEDSDFLQQRTLPGDTFADYYAIPLRSTETLHGILEIYQRTELKPDPEWQDFLHTLAGLAAIAADNARLFSDLEHANRDLVTSHDATIEGWSRALDLRDKETEGHSERVTEMTVRLARAMGIEEETVMQMRRGALLHDVGKLGIPDSILLKPTSLTEGEWEIMRKHPTYANEMLYPITFLRPALDIPYCHHEKWDGTGYPNELKEEDIPLAARIFAIADVYDALRSDRPYRAGWPIERVLKHIRSLSGIHFDPAVVEAFLKLDREEHY